MLRVVEPPPEDAGRVPAPASQAPNASPVAPLRGAEHVLPTPAIAFRNVSKRFTLQQRRGQGAGRALLDLLRLGLGKHRDTLWALRDVSFSLAPGRTLGIIGQNGSGKSTMLKLLSGVLRPNSGTVTVNGRVSALLELGAGFHPELTGRENVFLNGSFLGLSRRVIAERYDEIVRFAELERFMDTPVKHYSSGMYMRLGFAVAVHVDPDILLIDEVLAVGDASFRQKCYAVFSEFKRRGKTLVYVSHDMNSVARFCDEVLWLDHGTVRLHDVPERVVHRYLQAAKQHYESASGTSAAPTGALPASAAADVKPRETRWGSGEVRIESVEVCDAEGQPKRHFRSGEPVTIRLRYAATIACADVAFAVGLHRADDVYVNGARSDSALRVSVAAGSGEVACSYASLPLLEGSYRVSAGAWPGGCWDKPYDVRRGVTSFYLGSACNAAQAGLVALPHTRHVTGVAAPVAARPVPAVGPQPSADRPRWAPPPSRMIAGQRDEECLGAGWYPVEYWPPCVRWTAPRATLYLTAPPGATTLGLSLCRPNHTGEALEGRVLVDGEEVGAIHTAVPHFTDFEYPIPSRPEPRVLEVTIEVARPLVPSARGSGGDPRELGLVVREAWCE